MSEGLRGCQREVGPRGDGTGGRGDVRMPWETGRKQMASGDTIVASGRRIIFANEAEKSGVRLRVWLWKATDGILELVSYRGTGALSVTR